MTQLDAHLLVLHESSRVGELICGVVDSDHLRAASRERDGALTAPASEIEQPLPRDVTTEAQLVVSRDHEPIFVGAARRAGDTRSRAVP